MKYLFKSILIAFASVLSLTAAAQKPKTAIQLNDYFTSFTDSLYLGGREWGDALTKSMKTGDYSLLRRQRMKVELFADSKLQELRVMEDIKGSKEFRTALIKFLEFELSMIRDAFIPFESLDANSTKEKKNKLIADITAFADKEKDKLSDLNKEQEAYAAKNGFTIENANER